MTRITTFAAVFSVALALVCLFIAAGSPTYVNDHGVLVEPFAWMAAGRLLLVASAVFGAVAAANIALGRWG